MPNQYGAPEISPEEVSQLLQHDPKVIVLDVRELNELAQARLPHHRVFIAPLSEIVERGAEVLPPEAQDKNAPMIVMCHSGRRSAQVTSWLLSQGWKDVRSMAGGIRDYALRVDKSVGSY
jgi:rhodanese-related sulfurtransferase